VIKIKELTDILEDRYNEEKIVLKITEGLDKPIKEEIKKIKQEYEGWLCDFDLDARIIDALEIGELYQAFKADWESGNKKYVDREENKKGEVINYKIHYDWLTSDLIKYYCILTYKNQIWIYEEGSFKENENKIEKTINKLLKKDGLTDEKKIRDITNEIIQRIIWNTTIRKEEFNSFKTLIPLKNGMLLTNNGKRYLIPNSPAFAFTYQIPICFREDGNCDKIDKFFKEVVKEEDVPLLYELAGYCLFPTHKFHHAFMLVGNGANGKSTCLRLLENFLGKDNIANASLQKICYDRFASATLFGKLANVCADIPQKSINYTGEFKMLTGEDSIYADRKYHDPFSFHSHAKLIFSANKTPEVDDYSYAFWRRWILIEFPNKFEGNGCNQNLIEELSTKKELEGLLNKAIDSFDEVLEKKRFSISKSIETAKEEWMKKANSVYGFVKERTIRDLSGVIEKDIVFEDYLQYCEENDFVAKAKNTFSSDFQRLANAKPSQRRIEGLQKYVWLGIKLKEIGGIEKKVEEQQKLLTGVISH
jgi:putative DNA primase/helicase